MLDKIFLKPPWAQQDEVWLCKITYYAVVRACLVSQKHMHAFFHSVSDTHKYTHTYTKVGAHLSWTKCNSGFLEPAGSSMSLTIYCTQQDPTVALLSGLHLSSQGFSPSPAFPAHISKHALVSVCFPSPRLFPSHDYSSYIFSIS